MRELGEMLFKTPQRNLKDSWIQDTITVPM
jgi:hypothetical protein